MNKNVMGRPFVVVLYFIEREDEVEKVVEKPLVLSV